MNQVSISTGAISYIDRGAGPVVLAVHGFPLDHSMWNSQIDALANRARVIAPDLRGFGRSALGDVDLRVGITMERHADDLAELLNAIGIDEPVVFVGFSMGGYVAWPFVRKHVARLKALIQCDTRAGADSDEGRAGRLTMAENVAQWGSGRVFEMMKPKLFSARTIDTKGAILEEIRKVIERTSPAGIAAAQRGMAARPDVTELLAKIDVPTLVLCGSEDTISPPAEMKTMAAAIPDAEYVEIPSAGHMTTIENPAAVNEALIRFVEALG